VKLESRAAVCDKGRWWGESDIRIALGQLRQQISYSGPQRQAIEIERGFEFEIP
jgi:hypothetical protein